MKPIIGITVDCVKDPNDSRTRGKLELNWNYAEAVSEAGGVPILIPPTADMAVVSKMIHGWLIPGGNDIDAARFGEQNHPSVTLMEPERYEAEAALYKEADPAMPVFGICYGCQFLNVVRGGSLIQHLPDVVGHAQHSGGTMQRYKVDAESKLAALSTSEIEGKSYHHQAVKTLGRNLRVAGTGEDGTVEAIEATDHPWMIGLQWHPERSLEDEKTRRIFVGFIEAARQFAMSRA